MSAAIDRANRVQRLDGRQQTRELITEADVQKPTMLARILRAVVDAIAKLEQRYVPRRITYPPRTVDATGTTKYRFHHDFGGIPDVIVVRWEGAAAYNFAVDASSTEVTLVLVSKSAGTATIRLEEAP